jgi:hypothetical protein
VTYDADGSFHRCGDVNIVRDADSGNIEVILVSVTVRVPVDNVAGFARVSAAKQA